MRRPTVPFALTASLTATALVFAMFVLVTVISALPAHAADMPARKSIGEIFAEPVYDPRVKVVQNEERTVVIPLVRAPGYYGRAGDFAYRNYYGTSVWDIWTRYPYACAAYPVC